MLEDNKKSDWSKREIGAFWTQESSKGKYLSGTIEVDELGVKKKMKVIMFPNRYKDNDKKPDYVLYLSQDSQSDSTPKKEEVKSENNEIPETLV